MIIRIIFTRLKKTTVLLLSLKHGRICVNLSKVIGYSGTERINIYIML